MPRSIIKRWFPTLDSIRHNPNLRFLERFLEDPNLFHLNRHSVSVAMFWGLLIAIIPVPGQMPLAAIAAVMARCNLPITVALAWVSNPVTTPFLLLIAYQIGSLFFDAPHFNLSQVEFTLEWVTNSLVNVWKPLLFGCVALGTIVGALGYFVTRYLWRLHAITAWRRRQRLRAEKNQTNKNI